MIPKLMCSVGIFSRYKGPNLEKEGWILGESRMLEHKYIYKTKIQTVPKNRKTCSVTIQDPETRNL